MQNDILRGTLMNKELYLNNSYVNKLIEWILPRVSGEIRFYHRYIKNRSKQPWSCYSIYNAYENYHWSFKCTLPNGKNIKGDTFAQNEKLLTQIGSGMKSALLDKNVDNFLMYSRCTLEWGGVIKSNYNKLENMRTGILKYFESAITKLDPKSVDTLDCFDEIYMNSGFTKLYSLLLDDFVIYDSRVGAALGLLVRKFLEDNNIHTVPEELAFSYGNSRPTKSDTGPINKRNPSSNRFKFTQLANNDRKHIINNLYANWLLSEIAKSSKFQFENNPIRALESSLFMIGYQVNDGVKLPE